ncbi:hypothetical protein SIAM614_31601 [Stappia aggregata IAM 12614]|uniref:Uncharacterized protein n=1 Tax=Roseibium aggregatum (strain ATCC 25650 / DSM 13394 / JCM 20685 / NBRC 16684 / NCIMB 2208 / IAM 12614 / B1) TaxID=384765 RepID=A0P4E3_ROSAI|nr:hypothetical protein [Roseibium aggregatum]EAV40094.1 hypothetical protein SIAM614_31601 [Stappia aggregata IAM 12614] [Roseibium aggregatum IAM 12614]
MKHLMSNPEVVAEFASAKSPEEMARKFKRVISDALAEAIANGIDQALDATVTTFSNNQEIAGWETQIGGVIGNLTWERIGDTDVLPVTPIAVFAPRKSSDIVTHGGSVNIGVSIGVSF